MPKIQPKTHLIISIRVPIPLIKKLDSRGTDFAKSSGIAVTRAAVIRGILEKSFKDEEEAQTKAAASQPPALATSR